GLTWTFRLRDGVRFHDGTPLSAVHVVASLERQLFAGHPLAPLSGAVAPRLLRGAPGVVKEIKATDPRTVRIQLTLPYAPLLTALCHPGLSIVLNAPGDDGPRWLGTGPFAVAEIAPGRITLDTQRGHWAGEPRIARVVFVAEPDDSRALADLDARSLDVWIP